MSIDYEFDAPGDPERTAGVVRIVGERTESFNGLRVLDLACRTGAFSRALAQMGAEVLGIEGKPSNFARIPETPRTRYVLDDVRNLSPEKYGYFDVTLCLGILYHLEPTDAINLLRAMRSVTTEFAIVDTHVGSALDKATVDGRAYEGSWYSEGVPGPWSSMGNDHSFWFSAPSLQEACRDAGWSNVQVLPGIRWPGEPAGRYWMVID